MAGPGGDPIMTTRVDITGNVAPLQQAVAQAKVEAKKAGDTIQENLAGGSADKDARANYSRIVGSAAAVGGLVAILDKAVNSYKEFASAGASAVKEIEAIRNAIGGDIAIAAGITEYEKKILSIRENAQKLRRELGELEAVNLAGSIDRVALGMAVAGTESEYLAENIIGAGLANAGLVNQAIALYHAYNKGSEAADKIAEANIKSGEEAAKSAADVQKRNADDAAWLSSVVKLRRELRSMQNSELQGVEKIRAEEAAALDDVKDRMLGVSSEESRLLIKHLEQIRINADTRVKRYEEEIAMKAEAEKKAEEEKKAREEQNAAEKRDREMKDAAEMRAREREAADRQAKALADAYASAFDRIRTDAANAFPAERLIGSIETMIERLEALADQRSRLRG
jgi:hypothetical protein